MARNDGTQVGKWQPQTMVPQVGVREKEASEGQCWQDRWEWGRVHEHQLQQGQDHLDLIYHSIRGPA